MKASELIKELQERIDLYGDSDVIFRNTNDDDDIEVMSIYYDDEAERVVLSDFPDPFSPEVTPTGEQ